MIGSTSTSPRTAITDAYSELAPFEEAARTADWPRLVALFADRTDPDARLLAGAVVIDAAPDGFLEQVVAAQRSGAADVDPLALALLGERLIKIGWNIRGTQAAAHVGSAQFAGFHEHLRRAEVLLIEACARDPHEPLGWMPRLNTARGLELGQGEAQRRYDQLARSAPHCLQAQLTHLKQLSPKWSGSCDAMHKFARECIEAVPPGAVNGAVVAEAHIEHWLWLNWDKIGPGYWYIGSESVQQSLVAAAARSVLHPDHTPGYGWVAAHSAFAMAFSLARNFTAAAPHFRVLGSLSTELPWSYLGPGAFAKNRDKALRNG